MSELKLNVAIQSTGKYVNTRVDSLTTVTEVIDFLIESQYMAYQLFLLFFSDRNV
jgi:hypothetical protein